MYSRNYLANFTVNLIRRTQTNTEQPEIKDAKWNSMTNSCGKNIPTCGLFNMQEDNCKLAFDLQNVKNKDKLALYSKVRKHIQMESAIEEVFATYKTKLKD